MRKVISILLAIFFMVCCGVSTAFANIVNVKKGDFLLYGSPALLPYDKNWNVNKGYDNQAYLADKQVMAEQGGVYEPLFGSCFCTLDGTKYPMGEIFFWGHIGIACSDGIIDLDGSETIVILRPTALMLEWVDIDVMVAAYEYMTAGTDYNQPFIFVLIKWIQNYVVDNIDWISEETIKKWAQTYDIDFNDINPIAAQPSPVMGTEDYHDMYTEGFYRADIDCSSVALRSFVCGAEARIGCFRNFFMENHNALNSIDCIAPGGAVCSMLRLGFFKIVAPEIAVNNAGINPP